MRDKRETDKEVEALFRSLKIFDTMSRPINLGSSKLIKPVDKDGNPIYKSKEE